MAPDAPVLMTQLAVCRLGHRSEGQQIKSSQHRQSYRQRGRATSGCAKNGNPNTHLAANSVSTPPACVDCAPLLPDRLPDRRSKGEVEEGFEVEEGRGLVPYNMPNTQ
jgi:hypothetical protein